MISQFSEKWIKYFFTIASTVADQSKDPSTKVGCVVVNKYKHILATGYNGFPVGFHDTPERYNDRSFKLKHVCHAEANSICQAVSSGTSFRDAVIFVTLQPCIECCKLIVQSGISEVHFLINESKEIARMQELKEKGDQVLNDWRSSKDEALKMLIECGIRVYGHSVINKSDIHEIDIIKSRKYESSATGELIQVV